MVLIEEHPDSDVELALVNQQRALDVLLNDERVVLDLICCRLLARWRRSLVRGLDASSTFFTLGFELLAGTRADSRRRRGLVRLLLLAPDHGRLLPLSGFLRGRRSRVLLLLRHLFLADAVLLDELVQRVEVVEHVDAAPAVQVRRLEQPEVERVEVAQRHRVLLVRALLEVEGLELGDFAGVGDRLAQLRARHALQPLDLLVQRCVLLAGVGPRGGVDGLLVLQLELVVQLADELLLELLELVFVGLERLVEGDEGLQGLVDELVPRRVRDLDEEGDRHQVERVLLVQVTEALHDHQKVVLLGKQLVMLEMVDHLQTELVLRRGSMRLVFRVLLRRLLAHRALLARAGVRVAEPGKFDPVADRVPLEVEHRVHWLDFDPPAALLQRIAD